MDLCAFPERLQLQYRLHAFAMLLTFEQYGGFVGRRPDHVATGKVRIIISINNRSYSLLRKDGGEQVGCSEYYIDIFQNSCRSFTSYARLLIDKSVKKFWGADLRKMRL